MGKPNSLATRLNFVYWPYWPIFDWISRKKVTTDLDANLPALFGQLS